MDKPAMINTRNVRLIVGVLALLGIFAFFASSQHSLTHHTAASQLNKPASNSPPIPPPPQQQEQQQKEPEEHDDAKNTLQGTSHQGTKPPYEIDTPKSNKITAEKLDSSKPKGDSTKPKESNQEDKQMSTPEKVPVSDEKCNKVEYVVMIDAGSTGSRVHVYEFNTCVQPPALLSETFEMLKPGLSSFDTDTVGAAKSLDPLLEVALKKVPADKQKCTPVAVKATAGLRLLGEEKSKNILAEVRSHLEKDYPFAVVEGDGISIMDGKDEGVYAWVTANYLLGNIGGKEKLPTAAVFDLGGGSTQIVFEPDYKVDEVPVDGETKYQFTFGDNAYTLYQFSHLGYGLMQGRNKINQLVLKNKLSELDLQKYTKKEAKDAKGKGAVDVHNPCIPPGVVAKDVVVEFGDDEVYIVNMKGPSSKDATLAGGSQCRFLAEQVLNKDAECTTKPCSFNGVHQPSLTRTFNKNSDMYVFSYFYDRTSPVGMPSSFSVEELKDLSKLVCQGETLWQDVLLEDHVKNLSEEPQWCLDLSFITAMLHTGYDIPLSRELKTAKTIDNNELGWCLGASLPLLDKANAKWKCRIDEL
ncbi:Guanosine-diphosphatase [Candida viswanathii]|uniref:Guanosine-diphosphatase n=1 Tax=Candida viswanathii TaxID=5486 RepID=A0A367YGA8_9ASCO|nr:Guanosine-diphosphatase [Candida viswanathii]